MVTALRKNEVSSYTLGFQSQPEEIAQIALSVEGVLPAWLNGQLLRTNPSISDGNDARLRHWFDGFAMLHSFRFNNGSITYTSKMLENTAYSAFQQTGKLAAPEFATSPKQSWLERISSIFHPGFTDNGNVNITNLGNTFAALTETANAVQFDPENLSTKSKLRYQDNLPITMTTAHPHRLPNSQALINVGIEFGPYSKYIVYKINGNNFAREQLASIPVKEPGYLHSFAVTSKHVILVHCPFVVRPLDILLSGKPYIGNYRWAPELGTTIYGVSLNDGHLSFKAELEPFFMFHHINAFERADGKIILDVAAYDDAKIINQLYLDSLRCGQDVTAAAVTRIVVDPAANSAEKLRIKEDKIELPTINYQRHNGCRYRYAWAGRSSAPANFLDGLVKIDFDQNQNRYWAESGCFPGEPLFVPAPGDGSEDAGVILSVVLDSKRQTSFLLCLNASSMEEMARMYLPHFVPFGFHGQFIQSQGG